MPVYPTGSKVLIASFHKAGTYLVGELLNRFGVPSTNWHLDLRRVARYDPDRLEQGRTNPEEFMHRDSLASTVAAIPEGHSAVSHLPPYVFPPLDGFRILFVVRNLRHVLVSYCRWIARTGRLGSADAPWRCLTDGPDKLSGFLHERGDWLKALVREPFEWVWVPNSLTVSFEQLQGDYGRAQRMRLLREIARLVGFDGEDAALEGQLEATLSSETLTKSVGRSTVGSWWSQDAESYFVSSGLRDLNARLGYELENDSSLRDEAASLPRREGSCTVCSGDSSIPLPLGDYHRLNISYRLCRACLSVFQFPAPLAESFAAFADRLDIVALRRRETTFRDHRRTVSALGRAMPSTPGRCLQYGAAAQDLARSLRQRAGWHQWTVGQPGSDFDDESEGKGSYDLVVGVYALERSVDPSGTLRFLRDRLSRSGLIFLQFLDVESDEWPAWEALRADRPHAFCEDSVRVLLKRARLELVAVLRSGLPRYCFGVLARALRGEPGSTPSEWSPDRVEELRNRIGSRLAYRPGSALRLAGAARKLPLIGARFEDLAWRARTRSSFLRRSDELG